MKNKSKLLFIIMAITLTVTACGNSQTEMSIETNIEETIDVKMDIATRQIDNYEEELSKQKTEEKEEKDKSEKQEKEEKEELITRYKEDLAIYQEEYLELEKGINVKNNISLYKDNYYILKEGIIYKGKSEDIEDSKKMYKISEMFSEDGKYVESIDDLVVVDNKFIFVVNNKIKVIGIGTKETVKTLNATNDIKKLYGIHNGLIYYDGTNLRKVDMISDKYEREKHYKQEDKIIAKIFGNLLFKDGKLLFTGEVENVNIYEDTSKGEMKRIIDAKLVKEIAKTNYTTPEIQITPGEKRLGTTNLILLNFEEGKFKFIKEDFPYIVSSANLKNDEEVELIFNKEIEIVEENEETFYIPIELEMEKRFILDLLKFELRDSE